MPTRLDWQQPDFADRIAALVNDRREEAVDVSGTVREIIAAVRTSGDAALIDYSQRFDDVTLTPETVFVSADEIDAAVARCPADALAALTFAAERIRAFHDAQRPADLRRVEDSGIVTGYRWTAVDAAGVYAPGGLAAYPSSVLMNLIPAQVAGVNRIMLATPAKGGVINPLVLAAARLGGAHQVLRVGGAQAIAALAYGTAAVRPVDVITGPGNAYVAEAKRQVFGQVGIDMIAGPSEILVIADSANDPRHIAADLLSQAEHDAVAQSILITDDPRFADSVEAAVAALLPTLATGARAQQSWDRYGVVITVGNLAEQAPALCDQFAPEHAELCVDDAEAWLPHLKHVGSVFLGRMTPEAIGDYVAGPNHVLPTGRRARFSSGLSVTNFMKRSTFLHVPSAALPSLGPAAATLADAEGLPAHAQSVRVRLA
jgi:histidinol dehydrogenase